LTARVRRWLAPSLGAAAFVVVLALTPWLWAPLDSWILHQKEKVWSALETVVGHPVLYDRIAPSVLSALDFQNVRLVADDGTPLVTAASIRLSLDWSLVWQGRVSEALKKIQVINASVNLDSRRDQALIDRWTGFLKTSDTSGTLPQVDLEGFNLTARWTDGIRTVALDRAFVVLSSAHAQWDLHYRGAVSAQDKATKTEASLSVRGDLRADSGLQNLTLRTEISQVKTSWFDLDPVTLQMGVSPTEVTVAKVADRIPLDLQANWDRRSDRWTIRGAADQFVPNRLVRLKANYPWVGLTGGQFTGEFSYEVGGDLSFAGQALWAPGVLPSPLDQGQVSAQGRIRTEKGLYRFDDFRLDSSQVQVAFSGSIDPVTGLPDGTLGLQRWSVPGVGQARGSVSLVRQGGRVDFQGKGLAWDDLGTSNPSGWIARDGSLWTFAVGGPWDGSDGRFQIDGAFDGASTQLELKASVEGLPLSLAAQELKKQIRGFDLPADAWNLVAGASARVSWSPRGLAVSEASYSLVDPARPDRAFAGTASWSQNTLQFSADRVLWDGYSGHGTLSAEFSPDGSVAWNADAQALDRRLTLAGRWDGPAKVLTFAGTPGLAGTLRLRAPGSWSGNVSLDPFELVPGWTLGFRLQANLDGSRWTLEGDSVDLTGRYPWNQEPFQVHGRLAADAEFLRLGDLVVTDAHGTLGGTLISTWSADFSRPWSGRLALTTPETGREQPSADWTVNDPQNGRIKFDASGLDLGRVGIPQVQGRLATSGEAQIRDGKLSWTGQAALSEARWGDSPLGLRATATGEGTSVTVRGLNLSVNPLRISDGTLTWDAASRSWTSAAVVGLRIGTSDWASQWSASGAFGSNDPSMSFLLKVGSNTWAKKAFGDWSLQGQWGTAGWSAVSGDGGLSASGTPDGTFSVRAQSPLPVTGQASGRWKDTSLSMAIRGFRADLDLVREFVNTPAFAVTSGVASGDFTVEGSPADPEFNGALVIRGLSATSSFVRQTLGPVDIPVVLEGHRLRVDPVNIGTGGRSWVVSAGARIDHLVPEEYQIVIQTDSLSAIPATYQFTGISAVGGVTGLLIIRGTPLAVTLGGRLVLQDTSVTLKNTPQTGATGPSLGFNADLTLVTGRKVEFLWPNENLPLLRAVSTPNQTLSVKANDVASTWSVTGKLGLKTGEINYLSRTFVLKEGQLTFQESQAGFDPRISVRAEWKYRETSGTSVIGLRADGTLATFSPRFDSTPYKSAEELQQIVGTTLSLPTDYTNTSVDSALSVASDVGTSFLLTPFEETVKRNFKLDLFTVKTEILKRTLLNRNAILDASDYLDNTRLYFGKYVGDDLFLQGTLAFRRDDTVAAQVSTPMVVEPEFQMEFQTPFFLLNWTLLPQHPKTLFVTDNTVTFRWDWSY